MPDSPNDTGRVLTCVYCGHEYPQETPAWGDSVLTEHIRVCEQHPMRKAEADNKRLRAALIGLVGSESEEGLRQMAATISALPMPEDDKEKTLNAISALLETAPVT